MTPEGSSTVAVLVLVLLGAIVVIGYTRRSVKRAREAADEAASTARDALHRAELAEDRAREATAATAELRERLDQVDQQARQHAAERETQQVERDTQLAEQQRWEAHDRRGPTFELVGVRESRINQAVSIDVRMVGGPGVMEVEVRATDTAWCRGLSTGLVTPSRPPSPSITLAPVQPHAVARFLAVIDSDPPPTDAPGLTLTLTARSLTRGARENWERTLVIPIPASTRVA
ncbi:MAG TPA: hypothetical protein VFE65_05180 [Pseudonocardia sp.]|jgi:hypothetical protein|nr:hypothetical protein [Pseudonocardia sp.]